MLLQSPACQCLPDFATKICYGVGSVLDTRAITAATVTNSATNCKIVKQFKWICAFQILHHKLPSWRHPSCSGFTKKTWICEMEFCFNKPMFQEGVTSYSVTSLNACNSLAWSEFLWYCRSTAEIFALQYRFALLKMWYLDFYLDTDSLCN